MTPPIHPPTHTSAHMWESLKRSLIFEQKQIITIISKVIPSETLKCGWMSGWGRWISGWPTHAHINILIQILNGCLHWVGG